MSQRGTASYQRLAGWLLPDRVSLAVAAAERLDFECCVRPEIGRLLAVLAGGLPPGSLVGESGTGTGAGLAWMVSAADPAIRFLSYEYVPDRARAAMEIFRNDPNVEVICGDAAELLERGPFDLLVHDGGPGSGKTPGSVVADPTVVLRAGGTMTIDDYTPTTSWPPMLNDTIDTSRTHWLSHPDLRSTEIQVAPDLAVVVCRYLPPTTQERGQYPASPLARRT